MGESEHRQIVRDSLFVLADLRLISESGEYRIRVRNLSSGGLMAEGGPKVMRGQSVSLNVRNIGWVDGTIAWVQGNRYGIAFNEEIDPKVAREAAQPEESSYPVRRPLAARTKSADQSQLRKI